jgi:molybdopterin-guanine dinucleotide biosynthesis protein A
VVVAVLAGGRSRRMGVPKALVPLGGAPLIARPLAAARAAGLQAVVVAKPESPLPPLDVPVWHEPAAPVHPLCGLVAALERAGRPVVAVACDQPFLIAALLAELAAAAGNVVCEADGLQPFPGRYEPGALDALRAGLAAGAPLRATVATLSPHRLEVDARVVASVNDPEALAEAERWIA